VDAASTSSHRITDGGPLGLVDSGFLAPGSSFASTFAGAGTYSLVDTATGHAGAAWVSMTVSPKSGTPTTSFTIAWAAAAAPPGYVFDVQVRSYGTSRYVDFLVGTGDPSASFTPEAGATAYTFRSRLRNTVTGATTGWSLARSITVG
jgi:hypothetical protein